LNNLLGIDYGERYIGIAIKHEEVNIPYGHKIIDTKNNDINKELEVIIKNKKINKIVIGYPIGLNTNKTRMSNTVDEFIENILQKYNIPIEKIDERMTSKLINSNKNNRVDDLSAVEILETYIKND